NSMRWLKACRAGNVWTKTSVHAPGHLAIIEENVRGAPPDEIGPHAGRFPPILGRNVVHECRTVVTDAGDRVVCPAGGNEGSDGVTCSVGCPTGKRRDPTGAKN